MAIWNGTQQSKAALDAAQTAIQKAISQMK
jgi:hypothetical protein